MNQKQKKLKLGRSPIHGYGLFASEQIAAGDFVIVYDGEPISNDIVNSREKRYKDKGIMDSYLFRLNKTTVIDATTCGNNARFINHSCNLRRN